MHNQHNRRLWFQTALFLGIILCCGTVRAQISALADPYDNQKEKPKKVDGWTEERDEQLSITVRTMEMTVYPRAEPQPALKYQLIPDDFERVDGNSALYYLKAMGFLEQNSARERLMEFWREAQKRANDENKDYSEVPPAVWRSTPPSELPIDEVKEYLKLTSFQKFWLREAVKRPRFDMNRNIKDVEDPLSYLLPDIQELRSLARTQDLRCRLAIAENRLDDAIAILGQQYALANHLEQDEFLVSTLVGIACANIAWRDSLHLAQHPDAPNLYWAYASLPRPLVSMRHAMSTERNLLFEQLKILSEVDETPRTPGYWSDFIDRLIPQIGYLGYDMNFMPSKADPDTARSVMVGYIAAAYPGAKRYLIQQWDMDPDRVEAYPIAQVVFLAMVRFYEEWRDNTFKWTRLPYWQARNSAGMRNVDDDMREASAKAGFCSAPTMLLLPAVLAAGSAVARCDQTIALIQTVEAIRMYGALHNGQLPASLDELPVPAPVDPLTGKRIDYQKMGSRAVLSGHPVPGLRYRLIVRFATDEAR